MKRNIASRLPFLLESIDLPQTLVCSGRYSYTQLEPNGTAIDTIVVIVNASRRSIGLQAGNVVRKRQPMALRSHILTMQSGSRVYPPHQHVLRIRWHQERLTFYYRYRSSSACTRAVARESWHPTSSLLCCFSSGSSKMYQGIGSTVDFD
jgi:hypothetical protein